MTANLKWLALVVLALMLAVGAVGWWHARSSDKAYEQYKAQESQAKETINNLQEKLVGLRQSADEAEQRAQALEHDRDAAYKQLDQFGAQGRAAEERLKEAASQYEQKKADIAAS